METIHYNDMQFSVEKSGAGWDIICKRQDGSRAIAGAGLFAGLPDSDVAAQALALIKTVFPVGIRCVGPDVTHPLTIGDLKIVGPDVTHPSFIYWNKDSVSCPKEL
jgi:hypothetical protein